MDGKLNRANAASVEKRNFPFLFLLLKWHSFFVLSPTSDFWGPTSYVPPFPMAMPKQLRSLLCASAPSTSIPVMAPVTIATPTDKPTPASWNKA